MTTRHEDLVALLLGGLDDDEAARVSGEIDADPALRAERDEIERHLALHERVPEIQPRPALWRALEHEIDAEPARPRSPLKRFWMPLAAAALVLLAFYLPRPAASPAPRPLHGVVEGADGGWRCSGVSRVGVGDGVTITMDDATLVTLPAPQRLALRAGRVFLEVANDRRGFAVEAGGVTVETLGTAFGVALTPEGVLVEVETGSVRCGFDGRTRTLVAGRQLLVAAGREQESAAVAPRAWFSRPSLTANILDPSTIRVVIRNEMPDTIELAPPTAGAPLFFASFGGRDVPLGTLGSRPVTLEPGAELELTPLRLPRPLEDREALFLTWPAQGLKVEARR